MNPIHYHTIPLQHPYNPNADESESDEDVNETTKPVNIHKQDVNSLPTPPPNSPTEPIPIPKKVNDHWNIVFFGD